MEESPWAISKSPPKVPFSKEMSEGEKDGCTCADNISTGTNPDIPISCFILKKNSCRRFWCTNNKYCQTLQIFNGLIVFLVIGASIFSSIERPNELQRIEDSRTTMNETLTALVNLLTNQTNLTQEEAMNLTDQLVMFGSRIAEATENFDLEVNPIWTWGSALFFCITVVTTIGM